MPPYMLQVLVTFSSVVFSFPMTREWGKYAEELYGAGHLVREKLHDAELGVKRWAYKRTETGSRAIGAV